MSGDRLSGETLSKVAASLAAVLAGAGDDEVVLTRAAAASGALAKHCSPEELRVLLAAGPLGTPTGRCAVLHVLCALCMLCVCFGMQCALAWEGGWVHSPWHPLAALLAFAVGLRGGMLPPSAPLAFILQAACIHPSLYTAPPLQGGYSYLALLQSAVALPAPSGQP